MRTTLIIFVFILLAFWGLERGNAQEFDSNQPSGAYFLKIFKGNKHVIWKVIKE